MSITNATSQESLVKYPTPYKVVDGNLCMEVTEKHSTYDRKLSNFTPYIKSELTIDDGATETKYLRLAGTHANGEVLPEIDVSGKDFSSFNWLFEKWGAKCILEVGKSIREHLRYAIQQTAEYAEQQFIYQQTGWKKINSEWYYSLALQQSETIKTDKPSIVFVKKLYALIESGAVAVTHKDLSVGEDPYPRNFVGFEDEHYLYLNKDIAYRHVKVLCNDQGENFSLTSKALLKTLAEDGLIKTSQGINTVSVRYAGKNSRYLALDKFKVEQIVNGT